MEDIKFFEAKEHIGVLQERERERERERDLNIK